MTFTALATLEERRNRLRDQDDRGFTLIELLVVVIIIGILAAIAIPVYLGVQNNAKNSSTQSDVTNLKTAVVSLQTKSGNLPAASTWTAAPGAAAAGAPDWAGAGVTFSSGSGTSKLYYQVVDTTHFCVAAWNNSTSTAFYANESSGVTSGTTLPAGCTAVSGS